MKRPCDRSFKPLMTVFRLNLRSAASSPSSCSIISNWLSLDDFIRSLKSSTVYSSSPFLSFLSPSSSPPLTNDAVFLKDTILYFRWDGSCERDLFWGEKRKLGVFMLEVRVYNDLKRVITIDLALIKHNR
ncbi:pleckstrin homology (PH) domain-containing protein [Striga asiatica]|uniref:Pleckstrin homology (PH) domain-containing protein n=1 Tax=Striga asiatica TaxID=4170 RepID=A0A5A7P364_STRAF|nr:pleckstrin homology (PH) domain-containing protein [Striga asiatica]